MNKEKILIWGVGRNGIRCLQAIKHVCIVGFVDNNLSIEGNCFQGHRIFSPSEIADIAFDGIVISCIGAYAEVYNQITDMGLQHKVRKLEDVVDVIKWNVAQSPTTKGLEIKESEFIGLGPLLEKPIRLDKVRISESAYIGAYTYI